MKGASIQAGYFEGVQSDDPSLSLADVAVWNEFGTNDGHVPERPFLRPAFDKNIAKYQAVAKKMLADLKGGIGGLRILQTIGALMASDIKKEITNVRTPPNAPETIAAKGFDNPLIESGTLKNRADFKIEL